MRLNVVKSLIIHEREGFCIYDTDFSSFTYVLELPSFISRVLRLLYYCSCFRIGSPSPLTPSLPPPPLIQSLLYNQRLVYAIKVPLRPVKTRPVLHHFTDASLPPLSALKIQGPIFLTCLPDKEYLFSVPKSNVRELCSKRLF